MVTIIPTNLVTNSPFYLFSTLYRTQKQQSNFQVDGLVTRSFSAFCSRRVTLYFKAMPNSIDFWNEFSYMFPFRLQFNGFKQAHKYERLENNNWIILDSLGSIYMVYTNLTVMIHLNINHFEKYQLIMSKRHICKSKIHVFYHFYRH